MEFSRLENDMEEYSVLCASRLRERAAYCRELARGAMSSGVAQELESIARDYERDAENLENRASSTRGMPTRGLHAA